MSENLLPTGTNQSSPGANRAPARPPLNWPLVLGLGSLALLWPLAHLTGVSDAIGQPAAPLLILAFVGAVWIGVVGFGRVPRPVLTLALAGAAYGMVLILMGAIFGERAERASLPLSVIAALFELGQATVLGAVIGLVALAIQSRRGGRR
ncbi:MAG: hypothetical protein IRY85_16690 [Micromonosporaceae bacterium]|nr:hypothetical protein [Micromonosporaceae bacterium]